MESRALEFEPGIFELNTAFQFGHGYACTLHSWGTGGDEQREKAGSLPTTPSRQLVIGKDIPGAKVIFLLRMKELLTFHLNYCPFCRQINMNTDPDPETLAKAIEARSSVVTIFILRANKEGEGYYGSGFVIRSRHRSCIVITCSHVLAGSNGFDQNDDQILVRFCIKGKPPLQRIGSLIAQNHACDLAIFRVNNVPYKLQALKLVSSQVPIGRTAIPVGYSNPDAVALPGQYTRQVFTATPAVVAGAIAYVYSL